jgi:hypothetical protein
MAIGGYKYFITFLDKYSRYLYVELLKTKANVYLAIYKYINKLNNNKDYQIQIFATDNGTEYINIKVKDFLETKGITYQKSPPYTKEPNGIIERINRTILNKARSLLYNANLPLILWGEAVLTLVYLYNRSPHTQLQNKTPDEMKNNRKPNISHIQVFGSIVYFKNKGNHILKLDPKAKKGLLMGFGQNIYRIYDIESKRIIISRDIKILENYFIKDIESLETKNSEDIKISIGKSNITNISDTNTIIIYSLAVKHWTNSKNGYKW